MNKILKIAHRGYSEKYSENTISAFSNAIIHEADMIELDVHLSKDGQLVVIHDDDIDRTSNGIGSVKNLTLSQLKEYNFNCKNVNSEYLTIPTLEEVIDLVKGKVLLNIEIKNLPSRYKNIEKNVVDLLRKKDFLNNVIISSFDHYSLKEIKAIDPNIKTGMLYDSVWMKFKEEVIDLQVYSVHPSIDAFDSVQMKWARDNNILVYPWIAKNKSIIRQLIDTGLVNGIMVNELKLFN